MSFHDLVQQLISSQPGQLLGPLESSTRSPLLGGGITTDPLVLPTAPNSVGLGAVGTPLTMEQSIANLISGLGPGQTQQPVSVDQTNPLPPGIPTQPTTFPQVPSIEGGFVPPPIQQAPPILGGETTFNGVPTSPPLIPQLGGGGAGGLGHTDSVEDFGGLNPGFSFDPTTGALIEPGDQPAPGVPNIGTLQPSGGGGSTGSSRLTPEDIETFRRVAELEGFPTFVNNPAGNAADEGFGGSLPPPPFSDTPPDLGHLPFVTSTPTDNPPGTPGSFENPLLPAPVDPSPFATQGQGAVGTPLTMEQSIANAISGLGPGQTAPLPAPTTQPTNLLGPPPSGSVALSRNPTIEQRQVATDASNSIANFQNFNPIQQAGDPSQPLRDAQGNVIPEQPPTPPLVTPPPAPDLTSTDGGGTFTPGSPASTTTTQTLPTPPEGGATTPGTQFAPDFQFAIDPNNPDSTASFINALLTALGPGIASGQFSNFQRSPNDLGNALAGFESGSPFENLLNQLMSSQLQGGAGQQQVNFASEGQGSNVQDLIANLFGQPSQQSLSTGASSNLLSQLASGTFLPQTGNTSLQLRDRTSQFLGNPGELRVGTPGIQGFLEQQLRGSIEGGGISNQTIQAQRENILGPANEALLGRLNRQGGGVADINSPLFQELQRRQESEFLNNQLIQAGQNLQSQFGQAGQLGAQQFGQGNQNIQNIFSQAQLGGQFQNQLFNQIFGPAQAQGQLGQNQQQINQQAIGLGGQLQNLFAQQGFQASGQGLTREQLALQNQQQENQFGLGQSAISSDLIQTLLAGREGGGGLGTILALLTGSGGGGGILSQIPGLIDIFRGLPGNPSEGVPTEGTPEINPNEDTSQTGGFDIRNLIPLILSIPGILSDRAPELGPGTGFEQFEASFEGLPSPFFGPTTIGGGGLFGGRTPSGGFFNPFNLPLG